MRKIKIFIGSSITDLREDRVAIGNFFRQLNDVYLDQGLYFQLILCEDYDDAITLEGKQSRYDAEILDSELSVFIFFRKVGEYTRHEFDLAYGQFKKELRPKILTVFKCADTAGDVCDSVRGFAEMLDKELRHYYKTYVHIDSLKLWLIMQIKHMGFDRNLMEFENGKVRIGGEVVADYSLSPAFANHTELAHAKEELAGIDADYVRLKAAYLDKPGDFDLYMQYSEVAKRRAELQEQISSVEKTVIEQLQDIYTATKNGAISSRQAEGYRMLEAGRYKEALAILDSREIFSDMERNVRMLDASMQLEQTSREAVQTNVNEILQRIKALKAMGVTTEEAREIIELYDRITPVIQTYSLDHDPIVSYLDFLQKHSMNEQVYRVLESESGYLDSITDWKVRSEIYQSYGRYYTQMGQVPQAIEHYERAIKIAEGLLSMEENNEHYMECVLRYRYNLSLQYGRIGKKEQSKEHILRSLAVSRQLLERNGKYLRKHAEVLKQLAWTYDEDTDKLPHYREAVRLLGERYGQGEYDEELESSYAAALLTLASHLSFGAKRFAPDCEAYQHMRLALEITERLAKSNPAAHEREYAYACKCYADRLFDCRSEESPEPYYLLAYQTYERLHSRNPYAAVLAFALCNDRMGSYYKQKGDPRYREYYERYGRLLLERIELSAGNAPSVTAYDYYSLGALYQDKLNEPETALTYLAKAKELYEQIVADYPRDKKWLDYTVERIGECRALLP